MQMAATILEAALQVRHYISLVAFIAALGYLAYRYNRKVKTAAIASLPKADRLRATLGLYKVTDISSFLDGILPILVTLILGGLTAYWMHLEHSQPHPPTPGMVQVSVVKVEDVYKVTARFDPLRIDERFRVEIELAPDSGFTNVIYSGRIESPGSNSASFELFPAVLRNSTKGCARLVVMNREGALRAPGASSEWELASTGANR